MSRFEVIPAVDILGGRCVRLLRGDYRAVTDYGDPVAQARRWAREGVRWLHVVDLDGARDGRPRALAVAARIRRATGCRVQYGGGLRSPEAAAVALAVVDRVVVSSWALRDPEAVARLAARHPGRLAVSLDVRDGRVWADGWRTALDVDPALLARRFTAAGAAGVVVTTIDRDGTLAGVDPAAVSAAAAWGVPFWWAGGIAAAADVAAVRALGGPAACGVIVGRALYEGRVSAAEIVSAAEVGEVTGGC